MHSQSAGFTLIETLVVVGLVAVLAGVSAPIVSAGMSRYNVISASQQVASTVRAARFQAVGKNMQLRVRFNYPAATQYQVVDLANAPVGEVQYLPDGITFVAPTDIQVTTAGRMAAAVVITITDGNAAYDRTISVTTAGRVQMQ